jgi:hypothetical protein
VERGNLEWPEKMAGACRLLEDQIERKDRCRAAGHGVRKLLETDALAAQIVVGELLLRRRLAGVVDAVRKRCVLRGQQQQRQQTEKEASQFHAVLEGTPEV